MHFLMFPCFVSPAVSLFVLLDFLFLILLLPFATLILTPSTVELSPITPSGGSSSHGDQAWLQREAQALARFSHPNVVAIHEIGETPGGDVFVVMEHVDGVTLREWQTEPRTVDAILAVYRQAAAGLARDADGVLWLDGDRPGEALRAPEVDAQVTEVLVEENSVVQAGQTVIRLDVASLKIELERAEARLATVREDLLALERQYRQRRDELALAEEQRSFAERELARQRELVGAKLSPATRLELAEHEVLQARGRVEIGRASCRERVCLYV